MVPEFDESLLEEEAEKQVMEEKLVGMISLQEPSSWRVYIDAVANQRGSGVGRVVIYPDEIIIEKYLRLGFLAINNEAEYEALLVRMTMVQKTGGKTVAIFFDSRLVIG